MEAFIWPVRVYYEDTDSGGVVYYANYLKFMERARTEWLRQAGIEQDQLLREQSLLFMVRSAKLDYHRPARFNDFLMVHSRILVARRVSITFEQRITPAPDSQHILCRGEIKIACINAATFKPHPIPAVLLTEFNHGG